MSDRQGHIAEIDGVAREEPKNVLTNESEKVFTLSTRWLSQDVRAIERDNFAADKQRDIASSKRGDFVDATSASKES